MFQVDDKNKSLKFLSPKTDAARKVVKEISALRNDPKFIREESVLGHQTYVLRFSDEGGQGYKDLFFAPALQGALIKTVIVDEHATQVIEPTRVEVGNPPDDVFAANPDYPVNYDHFEKKIQLMKNSGKHDAAEQMRQQLQQQKDNK